MVKHQLSMAQAVPDVWLGHQLISATVPDRSWQQVGKSIERGIDCQTAGLYISETGHNLLQTVGWEIGKEYLKQFQTACLNIR